MGRGVNTGALSPVGFKYIQKIKAFKNGPEFIFKPGFDLQVEQVGPRELYRDDEGIS